MGYGQAGDKEGEGRAADNQEHNHRRHADRPGQGTMEGLYGQSPVKEGNHNGKGCTDGGGFGRGGNTGINAPNDTYGEDQEGPDPFQG